MPDRRKFGLALANMEPTRRVLRLRFETQARVVPPTRNLLSEALYVTIALPEFVAIDNIDGLT